VDDNEQIKDLSKEIGKAFKAVEFLSLSLAGVAGTALAVMFTIAAYHWIINHWQTAIIMLISIGGTITHATYKWYYK